MQIALLTIANFIAPLKKHFILLAFLTLLISKADQHTGDWGEKLS